MWIGRTDRLSVHRAEFIQIFHNISLANDKSTRGSNQGALNLDQPRSYVVACPLCKRNATQITILTHGSGLSRENVGELEALSSWPCLLCAMDAGAS